MMYFQQEAELKNELLIFFQGDEACRFSNKTRKFFCKSSDFSFMADKIAIDVKKKVYLFPVV